MTREDLAKANIINDKIIEAEKTIDTISKMRKVKGYPALLQVNNYKIMLSDEELYSILNDLESTVREHIEELEMDLEDISVE